MTQLRSAIVNRGLGSWGFQPLARALSAASGAPIYDEPADYNYVLGWPETELDEYPGSAFIPRATLELAADKRGIARAFLEAGVPTPETHLVESEAELVPFASDGGFCLKWPVGVGAHGHRRLRASDLADLPASRPRPFVVQEFIELARPEVFRIYGAGDEVFGFVARRFPEGARGGAWVSHAQGARYEDPGSAPDEARNAARAALASTGLLTRFGCVDLMQRTDGTWVVLEVGTDGVFNHVDRDLPWPDFVAEINERAARAFLAAAPSAASS